MGSIFDGIQRPLKVIYLLCGLIINFIYNTIYLNSNKGIVFYRILTK